MMRSDLIAALEDALKGSVVLDHAVHAAVCSWNLPLHGAALQEFEALGREGGNSYTTSVDVALSTVPDAYAPSHMGEMAPGIGRFGPFHALL